MAGQHAQKTIVVSGINMTDSGILSILRDCLTYLKPYAEARKIRIVALVARRDLIGVEGIDYLEFPKSKRSWFRRLYYEFIYFNALSKRLKPDVWLSLHDISARVQAKKKFTYCHNPTPFFTPGRTDWAFNPRLGIFALFYGCLYRLNIGSNNAVIVQQHWLKELFKKRFGAPEVWVCHPQIAMQLSEKVILPKDKIHLFYPAFPRTFKNFEVMAAALAELPDDLAQRFELHWTVSKDQNRYAAHLWKKFGHQTNIHFHGPLSRKKVAGFLEACDALVFPSKLETWGLPITEAEHLGKKILAADLPYAHETAGNYRSVWFFDPGNPSELAQLLKGLVSGQLPPSQGKPGLPADCETWNALFDRIFAP